MIENMDEMMQPYFHQRNKGFFEKCCGCCGRSNELLKKEIKFYNKFKKEVIQSYDESNIKHEVYNTY